MKYFVYILVCSDNSYYTGITNNLETRMEQHRVSSDGYVSKRKPFKLIFFEEFTNVFDAIEREKQIKGWSRRKKEALIKGDWSKIIDYSKSRG